MGIPGWLSSKEAARENGVTLRVMQALLARGLIQGAVRLGDGPRAPWLVPSPVIRIRGSRGPTNRPGLKIEPD